jgi:SAM-dependent methyltransferase
MEIYTKKYGENVGSVKGYAGFRNRRRLRLFTQLISVTQDDDLLEIGPNNCLILDAFKGKVRSVTGIDINEEVVHRANRSDLLCMDATHMTFAETSFTTVIGIEVFEHIPDLEKVFREINRVLLTGGKCYMTVPFEFFRGQQALGDAWFAYRDFRMARQLHVHNLNPRKIQEMITTTSLKMIHAKLIWIPGPSYFIVLQKMQ